MSGNNRKGTRSVAELQFMLTERDKAILCSIRSYRFLSTKHIYEFHFAGHASYTSGIRACTRVLTRLLGHRLIYRLDRTVGGGGGGSTSSIWGIDAAGDRLLRADPDRGAAAKRFRPYEPTTPFLAHTIAIADVSVRLQQLARADVLEVLEVVTEPTNWRTFTSGGRTLTLKPDLYIVTADSADEWHRFIEVDRATESIGVLKTKAAMYEALLRTGTLDRELGVFPEVLWLVPTDRRRELLQQALASDRQIDERIHRVITYDEFEFAVTPTSEVGLVPEEGDI